MVNSKEAITTGLIALAGAVIGAAATGCVQYVLQGRQDSYAEQQQRLDRAQEIITLVEESPETMLREKTAMYEAPFHFAPPATDPSRVVALTTLYFPSATKAARGYEAESAEYDEGLAEVAMSLAGKGKGNAHADQHDYYCVLEAGDQVLAAILNALHRQYNKRVPVIPLSSCRSYQYELKH